MGFVSRIGPMPSVSFAPPLATSVAAVVMLSGEDPAPAVAGTVRQTYAVDQVATIAHGRLADILGVVDDSVTHVWLLDGSTEPHPDALEALLHEMARLDADVVGSKGLNAGDQNQLDSVGFSTDVLGETHRGFDPGELDQEQYDVVRDIGYVSAASLLVRRGALSSVGGFDGRLDPESASLDLCQRIRLTGGRIVVAPSSEVVVSEEFRRGAPFWRREAGRLRAIMKAYSPVTLAWVLPMALLVGLIDGVLSPLRRRFTLPGFLAALAWNVVHLPETLRQRRAIGRSVGDEELFRYQRRGSLRMSQVAGSIAGLFSSTPLARNVATLVDSGEEALVRPSWIWPAGIVATVLIGTRSLFRLGLPTAGYTMPLDNSALDVLRAYAGGWNVAGLGSPEPYRPGVAISAVGQILMLGSPTVGGWFLTVVATLAAAAGMARLLDAMGVGVAGRYSGALLYVLGPAAWTIAQAGGWPTMMAAGVIPWVVHLGVRRPKGLWDVVSRLAIMALLTAVAAGYTVPALVIPTIILVILTLVEPGRGGFPVAMGSLSAVAALPLLLPWIGLLGTYDVLSRAGHDLHWSPNTWMVITLGLVFVLAVAFGSYRAVRLAGWGGLLAALAAVASRNSHREFLGSEIGLETSLAAIMVASFGIALIAAAGLMETRVGFSWIKWVAGLAVVVLAVAVLPYLFTGRGGLPGHDYDRLVRFTERDAGIAADGSSRILLVGSPATIPGDSRRLSEGLRYRVVSAPSPTLSELWLASDRIGDVELERALNRILDGSTIRGGAELAPFGIRWIIATSPNQLTPWLRGQLDLAELGQAPDGAFEIEPWISRAVDDRGVRWQFEMPDYVLRGDGPVGTALRIAENADARWDPDEFRQDDWAGIVALEGERRVVYQGSGVLRNLTWLAVLVGALYVMIAAMARRASLRREPL